MAGEGVLMRFSVVLFGLVIACGSSSTTPQSPTPSTTASAPAASASAAPVASASASASAVPSATAEVEPPPLKPLKEILANAKTIKLVWQERIDTNQGMTIDIKTDAAVKGILAAIGADQSPQGGVPGTMITFAFTFQDAAGNRIATVSLGASATMSDSNKKYGRIDLPDGTHAGVVVADYAGLQKRLKTLNVNLP
jgi:hypothetical protein